MTELGRQLRLTAESPEGLLVRGELARHHLDGDAPVQSELRAFEDGAHPALTD